MAYVLGFPNSDTSSSTTQTSTYAVNLTITPVIYININEFSNFTRASNNLQYTFCVPVSVNSSSVIVNDENAVFKQEIDFGSVRHFNSLTVSLWDVNGNALNLQNTDWTLVIFYE